MPKGNALPETAVKISTYAALDQYVKGFVDHFNLLILIGRPGLQKSVSLRKAVGKNACWLEGNVTPFRLYCKLYEHRNELVAIDDVDSLYADKAGVRLLKSVCQTEFRKTVAWHSSSAAMGKAGIPQEFTTTSRVAIIANDWRTLNDNVLAVEDRGHVVFFEPDPVEVHMRTAHWFWDQEIFDFMGERLHLIHQPSMRHYVKASELKAADMDWRGYLLGRFLTGPALLVATLRADPSYETESERVEAFTAMGGGTRSTYFYQSARLPKSVETPQILLKNASQAQPTTGQSWFEQIQGKAERWGRG